MMNEKTYTFSDDLISDLHKDAYGYRPGEGFWERWAKATDEEKQAEWDWLCQVLEREMAFEREAQAQAVVRFGKLIEQTIASGAGDRETALRWIMESSDCFGDWDYLAYQHGLPYNYFKKA
jgi:hypothetical protein